MWRKIAIQVGRLESVERDDDYCTVEPVCTVTSQASMTIDLGGVLNKRVGRAEQVGEDDESDGEGGEQDESGAWLDTEEELERDESNE